MTTRLCHVKDVEEHFGMHCAVSIKNDIDACERPLFAESRQVSMSLGHCLLGFNCTSKHQCNCSRQVLVMMLFGCKHQA